MRNLGVGVGVGGGVGEGEQETIKENEEGKRKKIIKLMKKHKNKVKRNNAIIMKKTGK